MQVPYEVRIIPTMTFRPMSPTLARLIENAHRDLQNAALYAPVEQPDVAPRTDGPSTAVDHRA
jgi:hypothetical protein